MSDAGLEARTIHGTKPTALDATVECLRRGYGEARSQAFYEGVVQVCYGSPIAKTGKRRSAWQAEGREWAQAEMSARTGRQS